MEIAPYKPKNNIRVITAANLFDGHDAAINVMRRIIQATGAEVIHLGHNRSVKEIVSAAIEEDAQAIAITSYQGGHIEFFKYTVDMLKERGAKHIRVFGGGGGVIVPSEMKELHDYGVARIYSPEDGRRMGLQGMINDLMQTSDFSPLEQDTLLPAKRSDLSPENVNLIARIITAIEEKRANKSGVERELSELREKKASNKLAPVIGVTGTGGSGKSSITDEIVNRFRRDNPDSSIAIFLVDPTRQKTGGALLGDRIRMNSIYDGRIYTRSFATRSSRSELSEAIEDAIALARLARFDLIVIESAGIGQGDSAVTRIADISLYVMTPEYGAATQLEKVEMLDYADFICINKFERSGAQDALRDVRKQYRRNYTKFDGSDDDLPIFGTIASQFNDPGVNMLYQRLVEKINLITGRSYHISPHLPKKTASEKFSPIILPERERYLSEIAETVRKYHRRTEKDAGLARKRQSLALAQSLVNEKMGKSGGENEIIAALESAKNEMENELSAESKQLLNCWAEMKEIYRRDKFTYQVRDKEITVDMYSRSLADTKIPKVILPDFQDEGEILKYLRKENVPGQFPYTAGVFPFKRTDEDPKRQFAGEGPPDRTNKRFHYLCRNEPAKRLSTAFDSVTLYGEDPDTRPDIFGKIGEAGVSVCTIEDIKRLYDGFDLCDPNTSVSMTINGPAPIMLAFFLNAAIDQQIEKFTKEKRRAPNAKEADEIKKNTLSSVRGTVQADILKEDQAQNTCIFSTEFALKMMGDIQEYFIENDVKNYYSVSISGYHIAEAGANPITQLALTLANGFTYIEYYLSRGMHIDSFAPNLSFFFSNGMDPEYSVIGRVARRIWAIALRDMYGGNERSQKLKYHIQTSGRSLHAQEIQFNDIRTTLQALMAIYDNCNSLHTNSYDEAVTTPTEESVRRAMAIQLIIAKEYGLMKNENGMQGSFIIEELTDLVEEAVLAEFDNLSKRSGVLGAMERQYQRGKIQDESLKYEQMKHSGEYPIIGVNTFLNPNTDFEESVSKMQLTRATVEEKNLQIERLNDFKRRNSEIAPKMLKKLKEVALSGGNIFAQMMETARYASLGQITSALYEVGGKYRRNM
ncbi:MAG: methylmalonyl-CoA mutase family protein [Myxococcota bacterium]